MAGEAINPVKPLPGRKSLFCPWDQHVIWEDEIYDALNDGEQHFGADALRHQVWYFSTAIADADVWTSGISGMIITAWQDDTPATGKGVSTSNTLAGVVTFNCDDNGGAQTHSGWLHTWSNGQ